MPCTERHFPMGKIRYLAKLNVYLIMAEIIVDDRNVNLEMVISGHAEEYSGRLPGIFLVADYPKTEDSSKSSGRGIWFLRDNYLSST